MRAAAAAATIMVACGSATPPASQQAALSPDPAPAPRSLARRLAAPRPTIDVTHLAPDLDAEARWPLGMNEHPTGDPSFDIAGALAQPGTDWHELCARGAQYRHLAAKQDLTAYLKAWCTDDEGDALYQLGLLRHSTIGGIAAAIQRDTARMVVSRGSSATAEGLLIRARLLDTPTADLIAASYLELGRVDDALAMTRLAADTDRSGIQATRCHRLVRVIASTAGTAREDAAAELHDIVRPNQSALPVGGRRLAPDATCKRLDDEVACAIAPSQKCLVSGVDYDPRPEAILVAYAEWPADAAGPETWAHVVDIASDGLPDERAYELVIGALRVELATTACEPTALAALKWKLGELQTLHQVPPQHAAELTALVNQVARLTELAPDSCAAETFAFTTTLVAQLKH